MLPLVLSENLSLSIDDSSSKDRLISAVDGFYHTLGQRHTQDSSRMGGPVTWVRPGNCQGQVSWQGRELPDLLKCGVLHPGSRRDYFILLLGRAAISLLFLPNLW